MNAIIIFICRDKTPPNGICLLFIVWMQIQLAICSGSSSNVYLLVVVEDRGQFSPLFWLIPPICHQIVSPPRHLSSLLYKLIGIVTLLVAHITFLPPPTRVYLLRSSDVCRPATQSSRHLNQTFFPKKIVMSQPATIQS